MSDEPVIVSATGATSMLGRQHRGNLIEQAMAAAVNAASEEARAIWEDPAIDAEEKRRRIAEIMSDDAIRDRKLAARAAAKARTRADEAEASAKASASE